MPTPESKDRWIVIIDYNLSRVADVRLMLDYARERYGLRSALIRPNPTAIDRSLADMVIDLEPREDRFVEKAIVALKPILGRIVAALPFSDNAVWSGAELASALGIRADSHSLAEAAYSKSVYREKESELAPYFKAKGVFVPRFERIHTLEALRRFAARCPRGFVLKPSCEGNNRGVLRLVPGDSLERAFEEVLPYLSGGLIAEELIPFEEEYSFDGMGDLTFITEKLSVKGRYPVEIGQVVPARSPARTLSAIRRAGTLANVIVGQRIGPFHNEIKFDPYSGESAVIEPNRRPAGMRIWHLAERVYGVNFFKLWVDSLVTGTVPHALPAPTGVAAIRELPAPLDGRAIFPNDASFAAKLFEDVAARAGGVGIEWSGFRLTIKPGDHVSKEARDNAGFIAEVCLYSPDAKLDVVGAFERFERAFKEIFSAYIEEEADEDLGSASNTVS